MADRWASYSCSVVRPSYSPFQPAERGRVPSLHRGEALQVLEDLLLGDLVGQRFQPAAPHELPAHLLDRPPHPRRDLLHPRIHLRRRRFEPFHLRDPVHHQRPPDGLLRRGPRRLPQLRELLRVHALARPEDAVEVLLDHRVGHLERVRLDDPVDELTPQLALCRSVRIPLEVLPDARPQRGEVLEITDAAGPRVVERGQLGTPDREQPDPYGLLPRLPVARHRHRAFHLLAGLQTTDPRLPLGHGLTLTASPSTGAASSTGRQTACSIRSRSMTRSTSSSRISGRGRTSRNPPSRSSWICGLISNATRNVRSAPGR